MHGQKNIKFPDAKQVWELLHSMKNDKFAQKFVSENWKKRPGRSKRRWDASIEMDDTAATADDD